MHTSYDDHRFRNQVDNALKRVRTILDTSRDPTYPADVPHQYEDKYMLVNFITNAALAAQLTCLELLGLTPAHLQKLKAWSNNRTISLRLRAEEKCTFDREVTKDVESATKHVTEYKGFGATHKVTDKVVTKVTEYFWKFDVSWSLFAYQGIESEEKLVLRERSASYEIVTGSKVAPHPVSSVKTPGDVNISWLLRNLSDSMTLNFEIKRTSSACRTPRRNPQVEEALSYFRSYYSFVNDVNNYFRNSLFPIQSNHGLDVNKITAEGTFVPVVPLFEESAKSRALNTCQEKAMVAIQKQDSDAVLQVGDVNHFLVEEKRSLLEKIAEMEKMFPAHGKAKLISSSEAILLMVVLHSKEISQHYSDGVNYVEEMLRRQLIAAIGKEVQTTDFVNYMIYHNRSLFKPEYEPRPFSYAVRRPDHDPEGMFTIDTTIGNDTPTPIQTTVRHSKATKPMYIQLNAATKVQFNGDRYLHGWISHTFSGNSGQTLALNARARQFSCFMLLIGRIASADEFDPKYALIIQNKDDLKIPLLLENVPAPNGGSSSIESLSPEQQRFCKAYRSMQLASTLFGVAVVQIKPQLEKVLNLPPDSLTKEIRLTQDLLELFLKYQIPADLLSYEGSPKADAQKKLQTVKGHVSAMQEMIAFSKENELEEQKMATMMAKVSSPTGALVAPTHGTVVIQPPQQYSQAARSGSSSAGQPKVELKQNEDLEDYTKMPKLLDTMFQQFDEDRALKASIINPTENWSRIAQKALLAPPAPAPVNAKWILEEKNKAYDLIDGLTRAGVLSLDFFDLHIVLANNHCFDSSLMDTVIKQNVNPIEKVERSTLIIASSIHGKPPAHLLREDQIERFATYNPKLLKEK